MKKSSYVGLMVVGIALLAKNALADGGPIPVPDGGICAILVAISMFALNLGRRLFR